MRRYEWNFGRTKESVINRNILLNRNPRFFSSLIFGLSSNNFVFRFVLLHLLPVVVGNDVLVQTRIMKISSTFTVSIVISGVTS